jgi:hypothetical protein
VTYKLIVNYQKAMSNRGNNCKLHATSCTLHAKTKWQGRIMNEAASKTLALLNIVLNVEVCDATGDAMKNYSGAQNNSATPLSH